MTSDRKHPAVFLLFFLLVLACSLSSCTGLLDQISMSEPPPATGQETPQKSKLPKIIAIMPFQNQTEVNGAEERLRKEIYNLFNSKPYVDIELAVIDEKISMLERVMNKKVMDLKPSEMCQAIGCDGLIFGNVTSYEKVYTGVYSQLSAAAEIWMVDAKTGTELIRIKDSVNYVEGDIPLTPIGAIMTAISTAANVRELQEVRMVNELSYKLLQQLPLPEGAPAISRPEIRAVITNVSEDPFGKGGIVRVGLYGEPGIVAAFDIGNFKKGLPMKETQPGVYLGGYATLPGDNTQDMPIIAYLMRPSGPDSQWIYTNGLVTIDTTAPPKVTDLRVVSFEDRIELSWGYPPDVLDLAGYLVLRSEQPLSGYEELEEVEQNVYSDRQVESGGVYYYRIVAVDRAGNRSEFSATNTVQTRVAAIEPTILTGVVQADTVLSGAYLLKGQLSVPRGVSLTIGPRTTIMAEEDAGIRVQGQLMVDGLNGQIILFSRKDRQWRGIVVEGGQVKMQGFLLSGSVAGVTLIESEGLVENAMITDNELGISISGTASVVVSNCWVAGNQTGIQLSGAGSKILQSVIARNGTGLFLKNFSGEVKDNIIIDNERNVFSDSPLKLAPNYLGRRPVHELTRFAEL